MLKKLSTLIFPTFKRKEGIEKQMHKYGRELTNKTLLLEKEYYTVFGTNGSKDIKNHLNWQRKKFLSDRTTRDTSWHT